MKLRSMLAGAAVAAMLVAGQAQALTFNLIDTGGTAPGTQARRGFDIAAGYWSSVFSDNVVMNLNIGFASLGAGILGSTGSARSLISMTQGYNALLADRTSRLDRQAVGNLPILGPSTLELDTGTTGAVTVLANGINATNNGYVDETLRLDNDGGVNNSTLAVTKASAKALGLTTDVNGDAINYGTPDGTVRFSSNFAFDFDPTNGIDANAYDFIGVAIHEIGHALGFVSGVDSYDGRTSADGLGFTRGTLEDFVVANTLDLFRYSAPDTLDWSTSNAPKYFSLDGGQTQLFGNSRFSLGAAFGDGRQASHWLDSAAGAPQLGILDPTSGRGQMQEVTALDLSAYDAIGWNVRVDTLANPGYRLSTASIFAQINPGIPEPGTWAMMIAGFALVGGAMRRRPRSVGVRFA